MAIILCDFELLIVEILSEGISKCYRNKNGRRKYLDCLKVHQRVDSDSCCFIIRFVSLPTELCSIECHISVRSSYKTAASLTAKRLFEQ